MNEIHIKNNVIEYVSEYNGMHSNGYWTMNKDQSWILDLDRVIAIGGINCMDGDDDSYFIVFIDSNFKKYFLNITRESQGIKKLNDLLEKKFQIGITKWCENFYDDAIVIYPKSLIEKKLYKKSFVKSLRKLLMIDHVADGKLNNLIKNVS